MEWSRHCRHVALCCCCGKVFMKWQPTGNDRVLFQIRVVVIGQIFAVTKAYIGACTMGRTLVVWPQR